MKLMQNLLNLILFLTITIKTVTNLKTSGKKDKKSVSFLNLTQNNKTELLTKRKLESNEPSEGFKEIRIYVDKTYIEYQQSIDPSISFFSNITSGLDKAKSTLEKLLKVKRSNSKINVIKKSDLKEWGFDNSSKINENLFEGEAGIDADLVIIPIFIKEESDLLSVGEPQKLEKGTDRPIVGVLKINQNKIWDTEKIKNHDYYINSIFLHQFTHILGFTYKMFEHFTGGLNNTIKFGEENRTHVNKTFIITTKVVEFAKKYFNCSRINGVELEDTPGNDGLSNSHWEARILLGEYMVSGPYTTEEVISEFTLALLEDSGWYEANYYTGGLMRFGKHQGCEFFEKDCCEYNRIAENLQTNFKNDFLVKLNQLSCSSGRQSRAYQFFDKGNPPIINYKRFEGYNDFYGKDIADYCFVSDIYQILESAEKKNEDKIYYVGSCNKGSNEYGSRRGISEIENIEEYGHIINNINSFCALSNVIPKEYQNPNSVIFPKCYLMHCTERSLTIQIVEQFVVCPRNGSTVKVTGNFLGYLYCPDYNLICTGTVMCNDMFDCVEKKSLYKNNTYDYDYTIETTQEFNNNPVIKVGYEETIDGVCPQYCSQCYKKKKCFECINDTYVLVGYRENDENPITCNKSEEVGDNYYRSKNDNVYYLCMDGCKNCTQGDKCNECYPTHYLNDTTSQCMKCNNVMEECVECIDSNKCEKCSPTYKLNEDHSVCIPIVDNCETYDKDNTKCEKCFEGYSLINGNTTCYLCNSSMEGCKTCTSEDHCIECYPTYELSYENKKCTEKVEHCKRYDESYINCLECKKPYILVYDLSENQSKCKSFDPEKDCEISIQYINEKDLSLLSNVSITNLVKEYLISGNDFGKVQHYINQKYNYTITIFKSSECTQHLISKGYFSIYTKEVLSSYNYEYYIRCFITYQYNNYINFYETSNGDPIPSDPNKNFEITNNFTNSMSDLIGNSLRKKVSNQNINLFDKQNEIFNDRCQNFTIYGIDVPLKIRLSTLYLGNNEVAYICTDSNCIIKEKSMIDYISNCECKINTDFDHLLKNKINDIKNIRDSSSSYSAESFELFSCIGDGFKKEIISINYGFYICVVCLVIQIIFFTSYLITKNKENKIKKSNIDVHSSGEMKEDIKEKEVIYNEHNIKGSLNKNNNNNNNVNYNIIDNNPSDRNTFNGDGNNDSNNDDILASNPPPKLLFYSKWFRKNNNLINDSSDKENDMQSRDEFPNDNVRRKKRQTVKKPVEDTDSEEEEEEDEEEEEEKEKEEKKEEKKEEEKEDEKEEKKEDEKEEDKKTADIISEENNVVISEVHNNPKLILKSVNKIEEEESKKKELKPVMTKEEMMRKKRVRSIKNYNEMQKMNFTNIINIDKKEEEKVEEKEESKVEEKEDEKEKSKVEEKEEPKISVQDSEKNGTKTEEVFNVSVIEEPEKKDDRTFCDFYFETLSIKQHIINLFSGFKCFEKSKSYIPFQMKIIRFIFMIIMNLFFNSLFLTQDHFVDKYEYFNKKYDFSFSTTLENISTGEQITYGFKNCFPTFLISLIICLVIQFIIGIIFYGNKKSLEEITENEKVENEEKEIEVVTLKMKIKYIIFGIISFILMICATLFILGFQAVYAGGFADYIACFLLTFIILQIIPFIISVIIAIMWYKGVKNNNKCLMKLSRLFLF